MLFLQQISKYADVKKETYLHLTDELEASHTPGLVDKVALSVIIDLIHSGLQACHP